MPAPRCISFCVSQHSPTMAASMKATKAMEAMKPSRAMKAMKKAAMKEVSPRLAKRDVYYGKRLETAGGLTKEDLVKNKRGKIVSRRMSEWGKKGGNGWVNACAIARFIFRLEKTDFRLLRKGSEVYKKAKEVYAQKGPGSDSECMCV